MPRARLEINRDLPQRWRFKHGAYYYSVPPGQEMFWEYKQLYYLGKTIEEAKEKFSDFGSRLQKNDTICNEKLKCHPDIILASRPYVACGVYFLINNKTVVYVGRSTNIPKRIGTHELRGVIKFDSVHWIAAEGFEQERLEQLYISAFMPEFNIRHAGKSDDL